MSKRLPFLFEKGGLWLNLKGKSKYIVIIAILIGLALSVTGVVAYWSSSLSSGNVIVELSDNEVNLQVDDLNGQFTGLLVPVGYDYFAGEVTEVELVYEVSIEEELIRSVQLLVEKLEVTIAGSSTYSHLVEVTIGDVLDQNVYDLLNDEVRIIVKVRLLEPIDEQEALERGLSLEMVNVTNSQIAYEAIKGQTINIKLGFKIVS